MKYQGVAVLSRDPFSFSRRTETGIGYWVRGYRELGIVPCLGTSTLTPTLSPQGRGRLGQGFPETLLA